MGTEPEGRLAIQECYFCGKETSTEEAVEGGWIPSFWEADGEVFEPTCPACAVTHLSYDGEEYVKTSDHTG